MTQMRTQLIISIMLIILINYQKRNRTVMNSEEPIGLGMAKNVYTNNYLFWIDLDIQN